MIERKQIEQIVGMAMGTASMCWIPLPSTQVFDDAEAAKWLDYAVDKIMALIEGEPDDSI